MHACDRQTDGRTDGQNYDSQDRPRICSRGKNSGDSFRRCKVVCILPTAVMFVLSPGRYYDNFTQEQCEDILNATFEYVQLSKRRLLNKLSLLQQTSSSSQVFF